MAKPRRCGPIANPFESGSPADADRLGQAMAAYLDGAGDNWPVDDPAQGERHDHGMLRLELAWLAQRVSEGEDLAVIDSAPLEGGVAAPIAEWIVKHARMLRAADDELAAHEIASAARPRQATRSARRRGPSPLQAPTPPAAHATRRLRRTPAHPTRRRAPHPRRRPTPARRLRQRRAGRPTRRARRPTHPCPTNPHGLQPR